MNLTSIPKEGLFSKYCFCSHTHPLREVARFLYTYPLLCLRRFEIKNTNFHTLSVSLCPCLLKFSINAKFYATVIHHRLTRPVTARIMLFFDSNVTANQTQNLFGDRKRILLERRVKLPILLGPGSGR